MYETMTRHQFSSSAVLFALPQLEARIRSSHPAEQMTGRASQQPMTSRCLSDVRLQTAMANPLLSTRARLARTTAHFLLLKPAETWARKNSCPAPVTSKGGHRGALHAKAQAAEVLQQGENSVLSDVSLTSSEKRRALRYVERYAT